MKNKILVMFVHQHRVSGTMERGRTIQMLDTPRLEPFQKLSCAIYK